VSPEELERALKDLPSIGRRVSSRERDADKQVWRVEISGKPYYVTFYRRSVGGTRASGGRALREFTGLQAMQRAGVPSPRAVAHLSGLSIRDVKGDAVLIEGVEPATPLDAYLNDLQLRGERAANHRDLAKQVIEIVGKLGDAKLGHGDLRLERFLLSDGKVYLAGGEGVRGGGMTTKDVMRLGASAAPFATRTDVIRAWAHFSGAPTPKTNPLLPRAWRDLVKRATRDNENFGSFSASDWSGWFFKRTNAPRRWAAASTLAISRDDWQREWPKLLSAIENDQLVGLKRERGGDVLAGDVFIGGRAVSVVVKRPRHNKWHRYIKETFRGLRARQAWTKAWSLVARDIPTAWPLLVMQRRNALGIPVQAVIVSERVQGELLATMDFDALPPRDRVTLFHRLGRTLRLIERRGRLLYDSKSPNWVVLADDKVGPTPVIVDVDGLRQFAPPMWPIDRLLRSLREHPRYTPEDSRWVCVGYAPRARLYEEPRSEERGESTSSDSTAISPHPNPLPSGERGPEGDVRE
jgi:tRNA A-37 threonylcarbamoyl transferase component Bud32